MVFFVCVCVSPAASRQLTPREKRREGLVGHILGDGVWAPGVRNLDGNDIKTPTLAIANIWTPLYF